MTALASWQQPGWMPPPPVVEATVFGELTGDGTRIVLITEGNDWGIARVANKLRALTPALESALVDGRKTGAMYCPATWPAVVQLGFTFSADPTMDWVPGPRLADWIADQAARRVETPPELSVGYPPGLSLRPYQVDGAEAIAAAGKYLLLDEMGLGKTITAICGVDSRRIRGHEVFPLVIVVPSWEVGDNWAREIRTWAPSWGEPVMYKGPGRQHLLLGAQVLITTYATARLDAADMRGPLVLLRPHALIADEAHWLKNKDARQTRAVCRVAHQAGTVVFATGTPVTRNTGDVWAALFGMDPASWGSRERTIARFCERVDDDYGPEKILGLKPAAAQEFFACLAGQMRRVAKADVLDQLPPKTYSVLRPEIPPEWRRAYDTMAADMLALLPDGGQLPVMDTLSRLTRLTQLASSAADVTVTQEWDDRLGLMVPKYTVRLKAPSWKAESLMGVIAKREHAGVPTVAFMASRQLALITGREYCEKAGLRTGYIIGTGDGITTKTRIRAKDDFQAGKLDVIICTAGAGGLGLTLTASDCCVMLQRPWPFDQAVQPEDRVHRIGAEIHDRVDIIDIVAQGTVDERARVLMREKAGQFSQFVRDPRILRELLGGLD